MSSFFHPFHIVSKSPWPLLGGGLGLSFLSSLLSLLKWGEGEGVAVCLFLLFCFSFFWWRDVSREALFSGDHGGEIQKNLKWGMGLFILSEVLFFAAWFWAFFHYGTAPSCEGGSLWPPLYVAPFDPFGVPLLNTGILLSSGVFVTWAHHNVLFSRSVTRPLFLTIFLGALFTYFQGVEYMEASFSVGEGSFGTSFFLSTGFHGLHVLVGTVFLVVCLLRGGGGHFVATHHVGLELSIWYWHFVDVVWLFLFSFVYWWSSLLTG